MEEGGSVHCPIKLMGTPAPLGSGKLDATKEVAAQAFTFTKRQKDMQKYQADERERGLIWGSSAHWTSPMYGVGPGPVTERCACAQQTLKPEPSARWAGAARASGSLTPPPLHE